MEYIVLVLGGARSGKSTFAEKLALYLRRGEEKIGYVATAEETGEDFRQRIRIHQAGRNKNFITYETPLDISGKIEKMLDDHRIIILECMTVWLGNLFFYRKREEIEPEVDKTVNKMASLMNKNAVRKDIEISALFNNKKQAFQTDAEELLKPDNRVLIIVSNELGLGIVPADEETRQYRDIHGRMNGKIASLADFVYFICSGIPWRMK